jgi:hypothetical protein
MQSVSPVFDDENVQFEKEIAKDQPAYIPVIGLPVSLEIIEPKSGNSKRINNWAIAIRFRLSDEERAEIAAGHDLVVTQLTFGKDLSPMNLQICAPGVKPVFSLEPEPLPQCPTCMKQQSGEDMQDAAHMAGTVQHPSGIDLISPEPANNLVEMPGKPSAADLDAVAAEQSIADATGSSV